MLSRPEPIETPAALPACPSGGDAPSHSPAEPAAALRILLAEDNDFNQQLIDHLLSDHSWKTFRSKSCAATRGAPRSKAVFACLTVALEERSCRKDILSRQYFEETLVHFPCQSGCPERVPSRSWVILICGDLQDVRQGE